MTLSHHLRAVAARFDRLREARCARKRHASALAAHPVRHTVFGRELVVVKDQPGHPDHCFLGGAEVEPLKAALAKAGIPFYAFAENDDDAVDATVFCFKSVDDRERFFEIQRACRMTQPRLGGHTAPLSSLRRFIAGDEPVGEAAMSDETRERFRCIAAT